MIRFRGYTPPPRDASLMFRALRQQAERECVIRENARLLERVTAAALYAR